MAKIGVKIELEGAPQYKENMANITAQTKLYQAQVKSLSAQMGSSMSAFQKSIAMSKALGQQLEAQKNKHKLLEEALAKEIEKNGEYSTYAIRLKTQLQNLNAEIAKTEEELNKLGGKWGAVGAQLQEVGDKIGNVGQKMAAVGETLTKSVTVPIVALGAASMKAFTEVDQGLDTIIQKTGATGTALEEMENVAKNIATTIPASFDEVGNAVGEVNTRFGLTGDKLQDLSTKFIEFSQLNGTQVSNSIDNVQSAMAAFGLKAEDASRVLDVFNKAGQDSGIGADRLASSLLANASAFTEMGWNINEAAGFIANLEKNGVDASAALSGLKKAFANASKDGISMEDAMKNLQETMASASSSTESYQAAIDLFGAKAGPAIAKAVNEGRLSFDQAANSITGYGDSVAKTFEATQDPIDKFQVNMNNLKLVGADIANSAAPLITKAMEKMAEVIQKISDAWNGLSEEQQETLVKIAAIAAAIGPIISIGAKIIEGIQRFVTGIGTVVSFIPTITGVIGTIGTVLTGTVIPAITGVVAALLPFLPIIAAVGAAIAAVVLIVKNWASITDFVSEKWSSLITYLSEAVSVIEQFFTEHFGILGEMISTRIEIIKTIITTAVELIKVVFVTFGEVLKALFTGDWEQIGQIIFNAFENIKTIISDAKAKIVKAIMQLIDSITEKFTSFIQDARDWGSHLIQNFIDGILEKWEALKQTVANVAQTVKDYLGFTEPKKGPMHSFNDWPKHMMENYARGISSAQFLVENAVAEVAQDVSVLADPFDYARMYDAVRQGASDATVSLAIGDREFSRKLKDLGVVF